MSPAKGLSIITGETGAGKSIMLGAIGLLLGERADTSQLFLDDEKCIIEGEFDISAYDLKAVFDEEEIDYDSFCIFRRELIPGGRTRGFINDTPVRLESMRRIGSLLMDIHSQHDTLLLGEQNFQLKIVDAYAKNEGIKQDYQGIYRSFKSIQTKLRKKEDELAQIKKEADYNRFIYTELQEAQLQPGEQEETESRLAVLENAEEIKSKLFESRELLDGNELSVIEWLRQLKAIFSQLSKFSVNYQNLQERTESVFLELKDILSEVERHSDEVFVDPETAELLKQRIDLIYRLQQKHALLSIDELLQLQAELEGKLGYSDELEWEIESLQKENKELEKQVSALAKRLSESRKVVSEAISQEICSLLANLGIPNASLQIHFQEVDAGPSGIDKVRFLFSANKGLEPRDLKDVASGGEFSRLMFVLKYILAGKTSLPTIIFDEIDTGISGEIALKLAKMMQKMAENHQVITITHLPQIASAGQKHFFVYKDESRDKTISNIRQLSDEDRLLEIAKMIGGDRPGQAAMNSALELIQAGK